MISCFIESVWVSESARDLRPNTRLRMHLTAQLPFFSLLVSTGLSAPQFGFNLGNFFGGFLGNRGNRGPTGQTAPAIGSQSSGLEKTINDISSFKSCNQEVDAEEAILPITSLEDRTSWWAGRLGAAASPSSRGTASAAPMAWGPWVLTVTPRRLSLRTLWLERVRDFSGPEAAWAGGTSGGPAAGLTTMWSGPTLAGQLCVPWYWCLLTTWCFRAGRAQPDNREGDETCLAVLNNFYNDGVKFHDVSCHHPKPIICEA